MTSITLKPTNVASFPEGGGHFWVFLQYIDGLRELGLDVSWLERFDTLGSPAADRRALELFRERMRYFGLEEAAVLYRRSESGRVEAMGSDAALERAVRTDLLLNFDYAIEPELLDRFDRTALVDIDPGLLQFWVSAGQLTVAGHDLYLTIGETVGTPRARFSDLGHEWKHFRPPVSLRLWPFVFDRDAPLLTTVSGWWGGDGKGEWITDGADVFFENNKRVTFLDFRRVPTLTDQQIELALALGDGDESLPDRNQDEPQWRPSRPPPDAPTDYIDDAHDLAELARHGWRVRHAAAVAGDPLSYQRYVQRSRGEFSCAKPSCMYFQNGWVSDRTLCYLASGKPVIVQDTGPSEFLPSGEGMFRFADLDGALAAIESMNADYRGHCEAARELARGSFDAPSVLTQLLDEILVAAR